MKDEAVEECFRIRPVPVPLTVSFTDMSLVLKKGGKRVLTEIFGRIRSFNITALMGPSGAGMVPEYCINRCLHAYVSDTSE